MESMSIDEMNMTMESVQWLLSENVRAGTMALFFALKTQFNKTKARAFYKWQQYMRLHKFLSPYKHSISMGRDQEIMYYAKQPHQQTEHIVQDTIARSQKKLMLSLKRDYLRFEKEAKQLQLQRTGTGRKSEEGLSLRDSFSSHPQNENTKLPSYMRGTVAVSAKYTTNAVPDHVVVTQITRATSPTKKFLTVPTSKSPTSRYNSTQRSSSAQGRLSQTKSTSPSRHTVNGRYNNNNTSPEFQIHSQQFRYKQYILQ
jgi:hypothetical protein